jgi:hypothetical protein
MTLLLKLLLNGLKTIEIKLQLLMKHLKFKF